MIIIMLINKLPYILQLHFILNANIFLMDGQRMCTFTFVTDFSNFQAPDFPQPNLPASPTTD
jgi:hypothetical protein